MRHGDTWRWIGPLVAASAVAACSSGHGTASATSTPERSAAAATATESPSAAAARAFAAVDWTTIKAPGRACLSASPVQLHTNAFLDYVAGHYVHRKEGEALIPSREGRPEHPGGSGPTYVHLTLDPSSIRYGYLDASHRLPATAVTLVCDNNGGTAAGQILFSVGVYTHRDGQLRLLGLVTPKQDPGLGHVTVISAQAITPGGVSVAEYWYGANDPDCCATGRAVSTWRYEDGGIRYAGTKITARPH